jgi:hypothetical protein
MKMDEVTLHIFHRFERAGLGAREIGTLQISMAAYFEFQQVCFIARYVKVEASLQSFGRCKFLVDFTAFKTIILQLFGDGPALWGPIQSVNQADKLCLGWRPIKHSKCGWYMSSKKMSLDGSGIWLKLPVNILSTRDAFHCSLERWPKLREEPEEAGCLWTW